MKWLAMKWRRTITHFRSENKSKDTFLTTLSVICEEISNAYNSSQRESSERDCVMIWYFLVLYKEITDITCRWFGVLYKCILYKLEGPDAQKMKTLPNLNLTFCLIWYPKAKRKQQKGGAMASTGMLQKKNLEQRLQRWACTQNGMTRAC